MSVKRILEKQLELNEYEPYGGGNESEFYRLDKSKDNSFLKEMQKLSKNSVLPKLEDVKSRIKKHASNGEKNMTLHHNLYDEYVIKWLTDQGFNVIETDDWRDGNFITITW